ncbi:SDR family oxidoreductase [Chitinophaga caseinilytica]|uniref:SDR family oxidoreductase n=1 Tax=Chitinophaga caseinilytica TaxID=2267521 RepID=UPI003C30B5EE
MILVTGVTGHLGKAVLRNLLQRTDAGNVAALARNPAKVEGLHVAVRQADYNDPASLEHAFRGIDTLYFVSGNDVQRRLEQHENVVTAAKEAGVGHIIYTSFQRKDESGRSPIADVAGGHLKTEAAIRASGVPFTFLLHNLYLDFIPFFIGKDVPDTGVIYQPAGNGKTAFASRDDLAEAAANILLSVGHEGKSYNFSNMAAWSYGDIAEIIGGIVGKKIEYVSPTPQEFLATLQQQGVSAEAADGALAWALAIRAGEFDTPGQDLERILGRAPMQPHELLAKVYGK